ncbi:hypothetical protein [Pedobacter sp. Hv1]|uniref:hypothetical protein n=1 Tax=Pedobacter sp. Hv1 TaxID=1740090 RepID=UPI0006D89F1E|nr:hypothetical protein [Pedobacter sp. Hv1]KQC02107.1 hypothetical protein AQF98_00600 [Pedobacter sp. Hv1]
MAKDGIKATGSFSLQIIDKRTGKCLEKFKENNLVLTLGHSNIAKLLGGNAAGKPITKIAVGTNGTSPALGNSSLTDVFSKSLTGVTYPTSNSTRFEWTILDSEANGMTIREFGLLNVDNVLFARKVRSEIVKTDAVSLVGTWTVTINS